MCNIAEDVKDNVIKLVRAIAPEFDGVDDEQIERLLFFYGDFVSKSYFGKRYERALALLIAHQLTLFQSISDSVAAGGDSSSSSIMRGDVVMEKEGDLQRQYSGDSSSSASASDALLSKTPYGKMYLSLLSMLRPLGVMRIKL